VDARLRADVSGERHRHAQRARSGGRGRLQENVYTSTVGCIGLPVPANGSTIPSTESDVPTDEQLSNDYKRSKFQAEAVAMELFREKNYPVVIVNPSAPIGPGDGKPTPTGRIIVDFLNRRLPAYLDTGLNWVHVRDVAIGHILAAEKGVCGQRYILGHQQGNWTMEQTLATLEKITGLPRRNGRFRIGSRWVWRRSAKVWHISPAKRRKPRSPACAWRGTKMWFNPFKAVEELGLPQTPPEQAFSDAVEWFRANGYVKK